MLWQRFSRAGWTGVLSGVKAGWHSVRQGIDFIDS